MWTIHKHKSFLQLKEQYSWIQDMYGVPQSPIHHAEGDVATHTQMVLEALEQDNDFKQLQPQQQELLWAAALLHDVEKRSTTFTDEQGDVVSPGHAKKGALTARSILYKEIDTPFYVREQIVALVRYHGLPIWLFSKPNPQKALLQASLEIESMELLYLLAKADVLGRICSDQEGLLYNIDLFKAYCIEQQCWQHAFTFTDMFSKLKYFLKEDAAPTFQHFNDTKTEVIVLAGIAGSGKDFFIKKHYPQLPVVSLDDLRRKNNIKHGDTKGNGQVIQEAKELAKSYLRKQQPFIWNATNITLQMREQLIDLFLVYNAYVKIIYVEVPYATLLKQNSNRNYAIPNIAIEKMIDKLEVPRQWEAHEVQYFVL
jgi:putative nucleotidyltransferase with HDIG domain